MPKSNKKEIYLDHAASVQANPSSIHASGVRAKSRLEGARREVADALGAKPSEIIFTSGGTESNNLVIQGTVWVWYENTHRRRLCVPHIVITNIEHPSVLHTCDMLKDRGLAEVSVVPVEPNGIVDPKKIQKVININTVLVSVMYANNEIGTIQPIREIAKVLRRYRKENKSYLTRLRHPLLTKERVGERCTYPMFHTDAVQAANYLDINVERLGVDFLSMSGSKIIGSEAGVGVLYKKKSVELAGVFGGGDQELGLRPGTENLSGVLRLAKALERTEKNKTREVKRLAKLRDYFISKIRNISKNQNDKIILNGDPEHSLPNLINITIPKIPADLLVIELSARGIMASSKSACKSKSVGGSYVIEAINPGIDPNVGGIRFSLAPTTSKRDIDVTMKALQEILKKLKKWYNGFYGYKRLKQITTHTFGGAT
jgi:cysteine desulfurase